MFTSTAISSPRPEAVKPIYYQLVYTNNSLNGGDDITFRPIGVNYDANLNRVALTFETEPRRSGRSSQSRRWAFGVGLVAAADWKRQFGQQHFGRKHHSGERSREPLYLGDGPRWGLARRSWSQGGDRQLRDQECDSLHARFPGSNSESGNRDNRYQHHVTRSDSDGIEVIYYNFASQLGTANSSVQLNAITEIQRTMARQVVSLYEKHIGVRFVESDNQGFTIGVGDMQVINPLTALTPVAANQPGDNITYAAGPLLANGEPIGRCDR